MTLSAIGQDRWPAVPLKRLFRVVNGSTPKSGEPSYWGGGVHWATPDDLGRLSGHALSSTRRTITAAGLASCGARVVPPGSLVLSTRAPIGHVAEAAIPVCTNQGCRSLWPFQSLSSRYFYYVLRAATDDLRALGRGTTFQELASTELGDFSVPNPPVKHQRAIADFLDRKTAAIDALIEKKERLIALLEEKRQALITQAVTKGLDPNVPMKDSGVEWLGEIPAHWESKKFKYVCRLETGHTPRRSVDEWWIPEECTIPWVSLNDTKTLESSDYISETKYKISPVGMANSSAHLIREGAVVFNRDGARVGLAAITTRPMAVSQHIIAWLCGPQMNNAFLLYVLYAMKPELYRITAGSTIPTIGMPDVLATSTPVPPLPKQSAIVEHVRASLTDTDAVVSKVHRQIELLREYRQAVITAAVTGKLDVTSEEAA